MAFAASADTAAAHHWIQRQWRALCVAQFVLATLGGLMWFNYNIGLAMVGFFFVLARPSLTAGGQPNHECDRDSTHERPRRRRPTHLDSDQLHTLFCVSLASLVVDYAWMFASAGADFAGSRVAHLDSMFQFAFVCNALGLVVKHGWLWALYLFRSQARGEQSDPISVWLNSFDAWPAFQSLVGLALPSAFSYLIGYSQVLISIISVGHLGAAELGAAGIATMLANVTGSCIGQGFNMALDTLVSNAHGARKYRLSGLYAQRAILIMTILSIPMACVWASGELILTTLGLPDVAPLAGVYSRYLIVGLWPWLVNDSYKRYLQAQGIVFPLLASSAVCLPIHILLTYCLVFRWELGFRGAALAVGLSNWNLLVSVVAFNRLSQWYRRRSAAAALAAASASASASAPHPLAAPCVAAAPSTATPSSDEFAALLDPSVVLVGSASESHGAATAHAVDDPDDNWPPLSRDVLRGWSSFFKLGAPSAASLVLEWGSYEATAWAAGLLGSVQLATHTIFMQTAALWYMIPLGISVAASTLTGVALGAGDTRRTQMFARLGLQSVFAYALLNGALYTLALRHSWPRVFSDDARVVEFASATMPIMFVYGIFDATYSVTSGVLRSAGRPSHVALGNLVACLGVGAPCVYAFSFVLGWGLVGIWAAMTLTWAAATAAYSVILFLRTDWEAEAAAAADRNLRATLEAQSSLDASDVAAAAEIAAAKAVIGDR